MTEFKLEKQKECIDEYIKINIFGQGSAHKITVIVLAACLFVLAVFGVAAYFITREWIMLLITALAVIMAVVYPMITRAILKSIAKKADEAPEITEVIAAVSESDILFIKNGVPIGGIDWEKIKEITEGKTGFFLITEDGSLLILAKAAVVSGTYDEAVQILRMKAALKK